MMKQFSLRQPRKLASLAFLLVALIFVLCVTIQIFIAGLATFVNPVNWANHISFVHIIEALALLLLLLAFAGRFPGSIRWRSAGLLALIFLQYFTANVTAVMPWLAATHPVIAMSLFWLSVHVAVMARDHVSIQ